MRTSRTSGSFSPISGPLGIFGEMWDVATLPSIDSENAEGQRERERELQLREGCP